MLLANKAGFLCVKNQETQQCRATKNADFAHCHIGQFISYDSDERKSGGGGGGGEE